MTDLLHRPATRIVDARGSFCPGPLMELIRAIRESAARPGDRRLQLRFGEQDGHPEVGREGGPPARRARAARRIRRDRRREDPLRPVMKRILILGGGVGGTLTANLLVKEAAPPGQGRRGDDHRRRPDRPAHLSARVHVHRHGRRASRATPAPRARPARQAGQPRRRRGRSGSTSRRRPSTSRTACRSATTTWSLATGSRIVPEEIEHFDTEAHHFYTAEAALELRRGARRVHAAAGSSIGIAGMPYKCPPAPLEVAFLIEAELRERGLRDASELHFCSPIGRAFTIESVSEMATPILEREGHRAAHVLQRRGDRSRAARRPESRGRGAPVRPAHPGPAA